MNKTTLDDIARRAGVTKSTVHRVLTGKGAVSAITREHVQAVVDEMNASPAHSVAPVQRHLALIHPGVWSPQLQGIYRPYYRGVLQAANEHNLVIHLVSAPVENTALRLVDEMQREGLLQLQAAVVMGLSETDETLLAFHRRGMPVCLLGRNLQNGPFSWVGANYQEGTRLAVEHLLGLGHRRIVLADQGHPSSSFGHWHRAGYFEALQGVGLNPDAALIVENAENNLDDVLAYVHVGATAVYATTDELAIAIFDRLTAEGYWVPEQVSLVGFNDFIAAEHQPPLTSVRWPYAQVGTLAVEIVSRLLDAPWLEAQRIVMRPELVVRATTAPVSHL